MAKQVIKIKTVKRSSSSRPRSGKRPPSRRVRRRIRKMLSELYMTCNLDEKEIFKKHLETLQNITQPNII